MYPNAEFDKAQILFFLYKVITEAKCNMAMLNTTKYSEHSLNSNLLELLNLPVQHYLYTMRFFMLLHGS